MYTWRQDVRNHFSFSHTHIPSSSTLKTCSSLWDSHTVCFPIVSINSCNIGSKRLGETVDSIVSYTTFLSYSLFIIIKVTCIWPWALQQAGTLYWNGMQILLGRAVEVLQPHISTPGTQMHLLLPLSVSLYVSHSSDCAPLCRAVQPYEFHHRP